jgi:hypothetical protein
MHKDVSTVNRVSKGEDPRPFRFIIHKITKIPYDYSDEGNRGIEPYL